MSKTEMNKPIQLVIIKNVGNYIICSINVIFFYYYFRGLIETPVHCSLRILDSQEPGPKSLLKSLVLLWKKKYMCKIYIMHLASVVNLYKNMTTRGKQGKQGKLLFICPL